MDGRLQKSFKQERCEQGLDVEFFKGRSGDCYMR